MGAAKHLLTHHLPDFLTSYSHHIKGTMNKNYKLLLIAGPFGRYVNCSMLKVTLKLALECELCVLRQLS